MGVFIPPMNQGMRMDFFLEGPFMPNRMKLDRETLGGLADMFGQIPGEFRTWNCIYQLSLDKCAMSSYYMHLYMQVLA